MRTLRGLLTVAAVAGLLLAGTLPTAEATAGSGLVPTSKCTVRPYGSCAGAQFQGTDFSGANLHHMNLSGANLYDANLSNANLSNANLSNTNLSIANLRGANLSGANLRGAVLLGTDLTSVRWGNAVCPNGRRGPYPCR